MRVPHTTDHDKEKQLTEQNEESKTPPILPRQHAALATLLRGSGVVQTRGSLVKPPGRTLPTSAVRLVGWRRGELVLAPLVKVRGGLDVAVARGVDKHGRRRGGRRRRRGLG